MTRKPITPRTADSGPLGPEDETRAAAGELALRVLPPVEEAEARLREANDTAFAAEVQAWNEHLAGFADAIPPVEPSGALWPRIYSVIAGSANDNTRVVFWRRWAVGSTGLLAASLVAVAVFASRPEPVVPAPVAATPAGGVTRVATLTLAQGEGGSAMTLVYDSATGSLYLSPTDAMAGAAGVPHLWLVKPEGGVQLVGAIDGAHASHHTLATTLGAVAGGATAVAVSMERPGHTPAADKPDGPVVASGELQRL